MPEYMIEVGGKQYVIEGPRPPSDADIQKLLSDAGVMKLSAPAPASQRARALVPGYAPEKPPRAPAAPIRPTPEMAVRTAIGLLGKPSKPAAAKPGVTETAGGALKELASIAAELYTKSPFEKQIQASAEKEKGIVAGVKRGAMGMVSPLNLMLPGLTPPVRGLGAGMTALGAAQAGPGIFQRARSGDVGGAVGESLPVLLPALIDAALGTRKLVEGRQAGKAGKPAAKPAAQKPAAAPVAPQEAPPARPAPPRPQAPPAPVGTPSRALPPTEVLPRRGRPAPAPEPPKRFPGPVPKPEETPAPPSGAPVETPEAASPNWRQPVADTSVVKTGARAQLLQSTTDPNTWMARDWDGSTRGRGTKAAATREFNRLNRGAAVEKPTVDAAPVVKPAPTAKPKPKPAEKASPVTGFTKEQETFLHGKLEEAAKGPLATPKPEPVTIKVPGDGQFTVHSAQQASNLAWSATGKKLSIPLKPETKQPVTERPQYPARAFTEEDAIKQYGGLDKAVASLERQIAAMEPAEKKGELNPARSLLSSLKGRQYKESPAGQFYDDVKSYSQREAATSTNARGDYARQYATHVWENKPETFPEPDPARYKVGPKVGARIRSEIDVKVARYRPAEVAEPQEPAPPPPPAPAEPTAAPAPEAPSAGRPSADVLARLDAKEAELRARIQQRGGIGKGKQTGAALGPEDFIDLAHIGAIKIAKGAVKFADWSAQMVEEWGEEVRPHLQRLWRTAQTTHKEMFGPEEAPGTAPERAGPEMAGSLNISRLGLPEEGKQTVREAVKATEPQATAQRRGVITHAETVEAAKTAPDISREQFLALPPGTALNERQQTAGRFHQDAILSDYDAARQKAQAEPNAVNQAEELRLLQDLQKAVVVNQGVATEAGRTLSARRIISEAQELPASKLVEQIYQEPSAPAQPAPTRRTGGRLRIDLTADEAARVAELKKSLAQKLSRASADPSGVGSLAAAIPDLAELIGIYMKAGIRNVKALRVQVEQDSGGPIAEPLWASAYAEAQNAVRKPPVTVSRPLAEWTRDLTGVLKTGAEILGEGYSVYPAWAKQMRQRAGVTAAEARTLWTRLRTEVEVRSGARTEQKQYVLRQLIGRIPPEKLEAFGRDVAGIPENAPDFTHRLNQVISRYNRPPLALTIGIEAQGFLKSLMSTADVSATLRQGIVPTLAHPVLSVFNRNSPFVKQLLAFGSKERYRQIEAEIHGRPNAELYRRSGLNLTEVGPDVFAALKEEAYQSQVAEKIPAFGEIVQAANRAYTTYLNKLRADLFDLRVRELEREFGRKPVSEAERLARYKAAAQRINSQTGRGTFGKAFEAAAPALSIGVYSPRLAASRVNLLGNLIGIAPKGERMVAWGDMVKFTGAVVGTLLVAKQMGAEVEGDPTSPDFGKVKIGDTRYDIAGGFLPYIRLIAIHMLGRKKTLAGKVVDVAGEKAGSEDLWDVTAQFVRGKAAPNIGAYFDWRTGKKITGQEVQFPRDLWQYVTPLAAQDMYDAMKEHGIVTGAAMGAPAVLGVGVQTIKPKPRKLRLKKSGLTERSL